MHDILLKLKKMFVGCYEKYPTIAVLVAYVVLTLAFTWPLITHLNTEIPKGGGDVYQVISSIDVEVGQMKFLDFPDKVMYLAQRINVFAPYVIFNLVFDKFTSYNLLFLLTYVLSGLGMFLLAKHFVKNDSAAFLAGLIYAFSPFHFYQSVSVHLGSMQQQWIPFLVLMLFLFFEKFQFKYFLGVCFFAFMIAMVEHQMLAFAVLFILMMAVYKIFTNRSILRNGKFWAYVGCSFALLALVAVFMFGDMLKVATSDNNFLDAGENAANKYSIKFLDPIAPPIFHSIWPSVSEGVQNVLLGGTNRGSYFLGFSVIAILAFFVILLRKKKVAEFSQGAYRKDVIFWSATTFLFYVFSLGNSFSIGKLTIYLPYYLIYKFLPFYENIRTTGRMFLFVMLGIAMLFAYGFVQLSKKYPDRRRLFGFAFAFLILLEFWVAPIEMMKVSHSTFYDKIAKDTEQYALIEIPGSTDYEFASYAMFTKSVHGKLALNGMPLARKVPGEFDMQQNTPVVKQLLYTIAKGNDPAGKDENDILEPFDYAQSNAVLSYHGVRYVTVSKLYAGQEVQDLTQKFLDENVATVAKFEDEFLIANEIKQVVPVGFYVNLNDVENNQFSSDFVAKDGMKFREMGDGASLKIMNMENIAKKVRIKISMKGAVDGLTVSSSSDPKKAIFSLTNSFEEYSFDATILAGENVIPFNVRDSKGNAVNILNSKKKQQAAIVSKIFVIAQ